MIKKFLKGCFNEDLKSDQIKISAMQCKAEVFIIRHFVLNYFIDSS